MDSIKFTLYEIVGYLLPGTISLVALIIGYSFTNNNVIHLKFSMVEVVVLLIIAYYLGHLNQAVGNFFSGIFEENAISKRSNSIDKLKKNLNIEQSLTNRELFAIIMNVSLVKYKTESMDIFTEREGFYRGSTVGLIFLSISLIIALRFNDIQIFNGDSCINLSQSNKIFLLMISSISSALFFLRYIRFLKYRINVMIDAHS